MGSKNRLKCHSKSLFAPKGKWGFLKNKWEQTGGGDALDSAHACYEKEIAKTRHIPVARAISSFPLLKNIVNLVNDILWEYRKFLKLSLQKFNILITGLLNTFPIQQIVLVKIFFGKWNAKLSNVEKIAAKKRRKYKKRYQDIATLLKKPPDSMTKRLLQRKKP